jgi:hypothetical protein
LSRSRGGAGPAAGLRVSVAACLGLLLIGGCAPLARDASTLPAAWAGELAIVEQVAPARVETMQTSAGDRLVPIFLLAGPVGLAAVGSHEGDFTTVNGRQYQVRMKDGEQRILQGFAVMQTGDCVLLRKDTAGRYVTPVRQEAGTCGF